MNILQFRAYDRANKRFCKFQVSQVILQYNTDRFDNRGMQLSHYAHNGLPFSKEEANRPEHEIAPDYADIEIFSGQKSIDQVPVYVGDYLKFPGDGDPTIYTVRWDNNQGGVGIFYKDSNVFKIGMSALMQVAGSIHTGERSDGTAG